MIPVRTLAAELGTLRMALLTMAGVLALFATDPGMPLSLHGPALIRTLVLPAAAPLVLFVLLFDILMSSVRLADAPPEARARWRRVLLVEVVFALGLLAAWLPFFREVLTPVAERWPGSNLNA